MEFYVDIRIKPDAEMRENVLLNKVYSKLHKALYDLSSNDIGVSFPESHIKLGRLIRLHSTKQRLQTLQRLSWLGRLQDYCQVGTISPTPENVTYRNISRIQSNMSPSKLRRLIKRESIKEEQIKRYRIAMFNKGLSHSYLEMESNSNGHKHRRYIHFGDIIHEPKVGIFDTFGLSKEATVPHF